MQILLHGDVYFARGLFMYALSHGLFNHTCFYSGIFTQRCFRTILHWAISIKRPKQADSFFQRNIYRRTFTHGHFYAGIHRHMAQKSSAGKSKITVPQLVFPYHLGYIIQIHSTSLIWYRIHTIYTCTDMVFINHVFMSSMCRNLGAQVVSASWTSVLLDSRRRPWKVPNGGFQWFQGWGGSDF